MFGAIAVLLMPGSVRGAGGGYNPIILRSQLQLDRAHVTPLPFVTNATATTTTRRIIDVVWHHRIITPLITLYPEVHSGWKYSPDLDAAMRLTFSPIWELTKRPRLPSTFIRYRLGRTVTPIRYAHPQRTLQSQWRGQGRGRGHHLITPTQASRFCASHAQ